MDEPAFMFGTEYIDGDAADTGGDGGLEDPTTFGGSVLHNRRFSKNCGLIKT